MLLSRNQSFFGVPSIGIVACVITCGLVALGLIVGLITHCVRSSKRKAAANREINSMGNHAVRQHTNQIGHQHTTTKELAEPNVALLRSIQNTQEVMSLNNLSNNIKIGL